MSKQQVFIDILDSDSETQKPQVKPPVVAQPSQVKTVPIKEPPTRTPIIGQVSQDKIFAGLDSNEVNQQIEFLQKLKQQGPARECKICITCWQLITVGEGKNAHKDHFVTGSFEAMTSATKTSLQQLCTSKGKTKNNQDSGVLEIELFSHSEAFAKKTGHLKQPQQPKETTPVQPPVPQKPSPAPQPKKPIEETKTTAAPPQQTKLPVTSQQIIQSTLSKNKSKPCSEVQTPSKSTTPFTPAQQKPVAQTPKVTTAQEPQVGSKRSHQDLQPKPQTTEQQSSKAPPAAALSSSSSDVAQVVDPPAEKKPATKPRSNDEERPTQTQTDSNSTPTNLTVMHLTKDQTNPIYLKEVDQSLQSTTQFQTKVIDLLEQISGQLESLENGLKRPCL